MKLLELTDFFSKTKKEYVVVEHIVRFEPHKHQYVHVEKEEVVEPQVISMADRFAFRRPIPVKKIIEKKTIVDRNGTRVILSGNVHTFVIETPEQVRDLLAAGNFVEVKGV